MKNRVDGLSKSLGDLSSYKNEVSNKLDKEPKSTLEDEGSK